MLTDFGKELRRIRLDRNELLKDMAARLKVSPAYLSAVENGKKKATESLYTQIVQFYNLDSSSAKELHDAYQRTQQEVILKMEQMNAGQRDLSLIFARKIDTLDELQLNAIRDILSKK